MWPIGQVKNSSKIGSKRYLGPTPFLEAWEQIEFVYPYDLHFDIKKVRITFPEKHESCIRNGTMYHSCYIDGENSIDLSPGLLFFGLVNQIIFPSTQQQKNKNKIATIIQFPWYFFGLKDRDKIWNSVRLILQEWIVRKKYLITQYDWWGCKSDTPYVQKVLSAIFKDKVISGNV